MCIIKKLFKPQVVSFKDGTYAIRKFSFIDWEYVYKDLSEDYPTYWWTIDSRHMSDCKSTNLETVIKMYNNLVDKGEPLK